MITFFTNLAADVLPVIIQTALYIYIFLVVQGIFLLLVALVGSLFGRSRKNKSTPTE